MKPRPMADRRVHCQTEFRVHSLGLIVFEARRALPRRQRLIHVALAPGSSGRSLGLLRVLLARGAILELFIIIAAPSSSIGFSTCMIPRGEHAVAGLSLVWT